MRYAHTNLIAADWKTLSRFYREVFDCVPVPPQRDLSGKWIERICGIENVHIVGEHLRLPGHGENGPTLEIFTFENCSGDTAHKALTRPGFAHIAFEVNDVRSTLPRVLAAGGSALGEVVSKECTGMGTATFVYVRDPEGNIIELQSWAR